jgi:hypothetical protein
MQRSWPFEDHVDPLPPIRTPEDFLRRHGTETDAIVIRIGLNGVQLVLVSKAGHWDRWVLASVEEAEEAARSLGISVSVGEFPEAVRVRMNTRRREADEFERGAYPEQGRVGAVRPYPENRPRRSSEETREDQAPAS